LQPWEYEHASQVGIGRYTRNWQRGDAVHYDRSKMEDDRTAQFAAAACELAVAKATNRYWHAHVWDHRDHGKYKNLPDVGDNIEVRRCRTRDAVAVRRSDAGRVVFAARTVDDEFRRVELIGYIEADKVIEGMARDEKWTYVPFTSLKPFDSTGGR